MAATALAAARIEPELKERAREILEQHDMTESQLIRRVYEYIVEAGAVPEFTLVEEYDVHLETGKRVKRKDKFERMLEWMRTGPLTRYDFTGIGDDALRESFDEAMDEKYGWR